MGTDTKEQEKKSGSNLKSFKPKCFYSYCVSRRKSYVTKEPYPYVWAAPKSTDQLEWINFIRKLPPDYVEVQELSHKHRFCHLHFEEKFIVKANTYNVDGKTYEVALRKWRLTPDAYPTLFDPQDQSSDLLPPRFQTGRVIKTVNKVQPSLSLSLLQDQNQNQEHSHQQDSSVASISLPLFNPPKSRQSKLEQDVDVDPLKLEGEDAGCDSVSSGSGCSEPDVAEKSSTSKETVNNKENPKHFERIKIENVKENSSSSLSLHDMVDINIQIATDCATSLQPKICDQTKSRVLHTPPGVSNCQEIGLEPESDTYRCDNSSSNTINIYRTINSSLKFRNPSCNNDSKGNGNGNFKNNSDKDIRLINSRTSQIKVVEVEKNTEIIDLEALETITKASNRKSKQVESEYQNVNSKSIFLSSVGKRKNKRKHELDPFYDVNLQPCFPSKKSCQSKDKDESVKINNSDSADSDSQECQSEDKEPSFMPNQTKPQLQPSILKRTIAKITTETEEQQQQQSVKQDKDKGYNVVTNVNSNPNLFPVKVLNPSFISGNIVIPQVIDVNQGAVSQISQVQTQTVQNQLPRVPVNSGVSRIPPLKQQFIVVRQTAPRTPPFGVPSIQLQGQRHDQNPIQRQSQIQGKGQPQPIIILGRQSVASGVPITLPLPVSGPAGTAASSNSRPLVPSVNVSGNQNTKLIILKQSSILPSNNSSNNTLTNYSNSKKSITALTARDLSLLRMPSPDWSVNTYPDVFCISETILSSDNIEIIRKSISIKSSSWFMRFSVFAQEVPKFSWGRSAVTGAGLGISEVQQVLNRFAEVTICSGMDLDSKSKPSNPKYWESRLRMLDLTSLSPASKSLRYDVDHNYRSQGCPLVIKNCPHPLNSDSNDSANDDKTSSSSMSSTGKKTNTLIRCPTCASLEALLMKTGAKQD